MQNTLIIKRALALLLLACFFLPLSQCTSKAPPESSAQQIAKTKVDVLIPYKEISFKSIDELGLILLFGWPLIAVTIRSFLIKKSHRFLFSMVEVGASLFSLYQLSLLLLLWQTILIGGYLAITGFIAYTVVSVISFCDGGRSCQ